MSDLTRHECDTEKHAIEYTRGSPHHYDGVSVLVCEHGSYGRWCGQKLLPGEVEPPFHGGGVHPIVKDLNV